MRSFPRHGLLSQALLMLGVVELPPPPREQPEGEPLRDWTPERPEEVAQVTFTTSKGETTWLPRDNVRLLLDEPGLSKRFKQERDYSEQVAREITMEIAKVDPLCLYSATKPSPSDVWAAICAIPREPGQGEGGVVFAGVEGPPGEEQPLRFGLARSGGDARCVPLAGGLTGWVGGLILFRCSFPAPVPSGPLVFTGLPRSAPS